MVRTLQEKAAAAKMLKALTADVTALTATTHHLDEIHELRSTAASRGSVVPIPTGGVPR